MHICILCSIHKVRCRKEAFCIWMKNEYIYNTHDVFLFYVYSTGDKVRVDVNIAN
jgi:hypothetical protein